MERDAQNLTATIAGCFFTLIGVVGFLFQGMLPAFSTTTTLNTLHLIIGAVAAVIGVWGSTLAARVHNRALGMALLLFAVLGFLSIDVAGIGVRVGDNIIHIAAGGACVVVARLRT